MPRAEHAIGPRHTHPQRPHARADAPYRTTDDGPPLVDQVGLVTGGGTGLGLAVAHPLVGAGLRVALPGRRAGRLAEAASELGPLAFAVPCDVTSPEDTAAALSGTATGYAVDMRAATLLTRTLAGEAAGAVG